MRIVDVITRKRDGHALTRDEIGFVIDQVTASRIPDYQASATRCRSCWRPWSRRAG
jgi:pyrimidine-nucleoside phosphorylase